MNITSFLVNFLRKNKGWFFSNIGLILLNYPLEIVAISYLSGQIFSKINNFSRNFNQLKYLFFLIIITYIILEISITIKDRVDLHYYPKLERELRLNMVDMVYKKNEINFNQLETGDLIGRLLKIPVHTSLFFDICNKYLVPFLITFIIVIAYLFTINTNLGLGITALIIIYLIVFNFLVKKNMEVSSNKEKDENKLMKQIDDRLHNSMNIFTSGQTDFEKQYLLEIHNEFEKSVKKELSDSANIKLATASMNVIVFIALIVSTFYLFYKKKITSAQTISIVTLSLFLVKHLRVLSRRVCDGAIFFGKMKETDEFVKELEDNTVKDGELMGFINKGQIEFKNVSFAYYKLPIFSKKTFVVKPRECVVLLGKSGRGKTTALKLLMGFYEKQGGEILIDGIDVSQIQKKYLRSKLSYVNQKTVLFNETVLYNIQYGNNVRKEMVLNEINRLGVGGIFKNLPDGLNTNVGKFGDKLSGGQKQMVLLLRCYFHKNPIILLDEPTASVDDHHKEAVYRMIYFLNKQSTVIIVTHDNKLANLVKKKVWF